MNVLMSMENVTQSVLAALKGAKTPAEEFTRRKAVIADMERESSIQFRINLFASVSLP